MGAGACNGYMACDNSRSLCLPACTGDEQCARGSSCHLVGGNPGGGTPSNYCLGTGGGGDGGVPDGGSKEPYAISYFATPTEPRGLAVGHLTSDAILDLVVVTFQDGRARLLRGGGNGTFTMPQEDWLDDNPYWVGLGHFDSDLEGTLDYVFLHWNAYEPDVRRGNPGGGMSYIGGSPSLGFRPTAAAVAHLQSGATWDDLVVISQETNQLRAVLGDGTGLLVGATPVGNLPQPRALAVGDFNFDGVDDVVVTTENDGGLHLYLSNGDGTFAAAEAIQSVGGAYGVRAVAVGKLDDGPSPDVVVAVQPGVPGDAFKVLFDWPGPGFGAAGIPGNSQSYETVFLGDFDGDGLTDVGTLNSLSGPSPEVALFYNHDLRTFDPARRYKLEVASLGAAASAVVGRFNGDQCDDIAVTIPDHDQVAVLVSNKCPPE
jgi:hypothetical protein